MFEEMSPKNAQKLFWMMIGKLTTIAKEVENWEEWIKYMDNTLEEKIKEEKEGEETKDSNTE